MLLAFEAVSRFLFYIKIVLVKNFIIQKFTYGHIKALGKHYKGGKSYRFVAPVHYALHTAVLYAGILL